MAYTVKRLEEFSDWLKVLKDGLTRLRLIKRLRKVQLGNLGDVEPVGEGVYEMRTLRSGLAHVLRPKRWRVNRDAWRWE